jgi:hypothetical protein
VRDEVEKSEFSVNPPPSIPSGSHHGQSEDNGGDARSKIRKLLPKFQGVCHESLCKLRNNTHAIS